MCNLPVKLDSIELDRVLQKVFLRLGLALLKIIRRIEGFWSTTCVFPFLEHNIDWFPSPSLFPPSSFLSQTIRQSSLSCLISMSSQNLTDRNTWNPVVPSLQLEFQIAPSDRPFSTFERVSVSSFLCSFPIDLPLQNDSRSASRQLVEILKKTKCAHCVFWHKDTVWYTLSFDGMEYVRESYRSSSPS